MSMVVRTGRRAAEGLAAKGDGTVAQLPFMPPQYHSSAVHTPRAGDAAAAAVVVVTLDAAGLYGAAPVLTNATCPPAIGAMNCESFALLAPDCTWHAATAAIGARWRVPGCVRVPNWCGRVRGTH